VDVGAFSKRSCPAWSSSAEPAHASEVVCLGAFSKTSACNSSIFHRCCRCPARLRLWLLSGLRNRGLHDVMR